MRAEEQANGMTMADMAVQLPRHAASSAAGRARFFNSGNAFALEASRIPDAVFCDEPAAALMRGAPGGLIHCDLSASLEIDGPATSPLLLASYAVISANDALSGNCHATASIWYVIRGRGQTKCRGEQFDWAVDDLFLLPGGSGTELTAGPDGAVLWRVTNEPHLVFEGLQPPPEEAAVTPVVHYPAAEITRQIEKIYRVARGEQTAGLAIIFSSDQQQGRRNILPTLTLAMNSLPPGEMQPPHRHNSIAVALVVQGLDCYSMIDGQRKDWSPWATTVTPPGTLHSHHNDGGERALFLIVQDGGLYTYARTMGFSFS